MHNCQLPLCPHTRPHTTQAPDLYLGYGATKDAPLAYSFEYPLDWTEQVVTKTDKSTMVRSMLLRWCQHSVCDAHLVIDKMRLG